MKEVLVLVWGDVGHQVVGLCLVVVEEDSVTFLELSDSDLETPRSGRPQTLNLPGLVPELGSQLVGVW